MLMDDEPARSGHGWENALLECVRQFEDEPTFAIPRLLNLTCRGVSASAGRVLLLAADSGRLETVAIHPDSGDDAAVITVFGPASTDPASYPRSRQVDEPLVRFPATRNGLVIGAVEVEMPRPTAEDLLFLETVAEVLPMARANQALHAGLIDIPAIPDTDGDEAAFQSDVHRYLDAHTRTALTCVFAVDQRAEVSVIFGPPDQAMMDALQDDQLSLRVLEAALAAPSVDFVGEPALPGIVDATLISHRPGDAAATTAAASMSEDLTYVLLAGFSFRYRPSPAEIAVLTFSVGLASHLHATYDHVHHVAGRLGQVAEIGSAITGLEISQKARHHAFTQIDLAQHLLADLAKSTSHATVERISLALNSVHADLIEIKNATRAPERDLLPTRLKPLWLSACSQVRHRLGNRIRVHYDGPDVEVMAAPDWFRQVFLNLLLNSADAFGPGGRQGRIVLQVDRTSIPSGVVRMTYSDTAGGIMPQHFLECDVAEGMALHQRIFQPGVTSKAGGSGWGLHVCRSILRAHDGSIELEDGRRGVSFRLSLPTTEGQA